EEQYKKGIDRFIREAGNLAKFNNLSGIVSVKEFFYENNTAYMVMEYIDGVTLSEYLNDNDGKLPYTKVIEMMDSVMDSLEKVHEAGIIHRDISPDNIMVTNDGKMKLIDFGAARIVDNNDVKSLTVILKHGYAPEEQYQPDGNQGAWTDIYALASTMYRMITGTVPQESTDRVLNGDKVVAVNKLVSDVPKKISDAIMHGLAVKVSDRPQKISDFKTELTTGRRVKPAFCFGIAAVIIAMIAVVGILLSRRGNEEAVAEIDNSEETVIEQSIQANESQDVSATAEEEPPQEEPSNEKTEPELISMIEEASGQKVAFSEYEDFDEDGYKELYSLTVPQSNNEESKGDSGQIWYADVEDAVQVMDTGTSSSYTYSGESNHGLLHFGKTIHFYIESQVDENGLESISLGVVNENPQLIYQGTNLLDTNDKDVPVVRKMEYIWDYDKQDFDVSYHEPVEILFRHGRYFEKGMVTEKISNQYRVYTLGESIEAFDSSYQLQLNSEESKSYTKDELIDICEQYFDSEFHIPDTDIRTCYSIYDDFDSDGVNESFVYLESVYQENLNMQAMGLYYVDGECIICLDEAYCEPLQGFGYEEIQEVLFGHTRMCKSRCVTELIQNVHLYEITDEGIIKYYRVDGIESDDNGGVYRYSYYDVLYNMKTNTWEFVTDPTSECIDYTKIWFIDHTFLECASTEIGVDELKEYKGGEQIIKSYKDIISNEEIDSATIFSKQINSEDYDIESILLCSDGYIYMNCVPIKNLNENKYSVWDIDENDDTIDGIATVVIKLLINHDDLSVSLDGLYLGYRKTRNTGFTPYYPQESNLN
ncbi:Protein kinase domain-containing protein, partial [Lachnospiraceae bacterium XBB2008]